MDIKTVTRKWGNSIAVIVPEIIVKEKNIRANQQIIINIETHPLARDTYGFLEKELKKFDTQKIKNEMKKGWDNNAEQILLG